MQDIVIVLACEPTISLTIQVVSNDEKWLHLMCISLIVDSTMDTALINA